MSQHQIVDTNLEMEMDTEMNTEDTSNDDFTDQLVLGLAAHPLNSCNPPPRELPDLLDSLVASEGRLKAQLILIDRVGEGFDRRTQNLRNRMRQLEVAHNKLKKEHKASVFTDEHRILQAKGRVLQKMFLQVAFIHDTFVSKIKPLTMTAIKAHQDILNEFLGQRHGHPGIQVADSSKLLCTPDCTWYQQHGRYEWTRKPYSNIWWEEMNNTDWNWLMIKDHMSLTVTAGGGKISAMYDMLQANSQKFIPCWFWAEDFETWTLHGDMESVKDDNGQMVHKVVVKVRFNKPAAMIQRETVEKLEQTRKDGIEQGKPEADSTEVEMDNIGEAVIDEDIVFDAMASMAGAGRQMRWLAWWGFEKWHAEAVQRRVGRDGAQ